MRRISLVLVSLVALSLPAAAQQGSAPAPPNPAPFDHVHGGNVVPPGNTGHISARDLATGRSRHMTDQRDLYVEFGLKDWSFMFTQGGTSTGDASKAPPPTPVTPRPGVEIYRDNWGVPRVFGATDADAQFGVGYAMAQDRMFQADVFRHVARGEMAEFIGGQTWYDYDREWRKEFYRDEELLAMFERFYTPEERDLIQAYIDGINAYIAETRTNPDKLPAEYPALGIVPQPWELRHALSIFVLQARDSVEAFGKELYNAALLTDLRERLGDDAARRVFNDVRFYRDPGAYTTAPPSAGVFPYPGGGFEGIDAPGVVLPDTPEQAEALAARDALLTQALTAVGLARRQASNAIAVAPKLTADGRPILLGGPQLAYLVPGIFWEFEVHSPSQHARGIGFAGTAGVVLIGKSPTHSWSITYGYTDQIDVFLVPLDEDKTHYLRDGQRKPLETYTTTVRCKVDHAGLASPEPKDLCDNLPAHQSTVTVRRVPEYGPVIGEVSVGGEPHAVVKVRAHWMREVANGRPFTTFNRATTIDEFRGAQRDFNVSLNLNYVDDQGNAGFWHVARPPIRAQGTDVRLPTLGDGRFDWRGFVPLDDIPHAINPEQGYTANWNNQIAQGWHNGDQNSWADIQRVDMLARRMERLAARGNVTPDDIWQVNREAAYEDGRFHDFVPLLLSAYQSDPPADATVAAALAHVRGWNGQRTASKDDQGVWRYDAAAVGIFDRFFVHLEREVLKAPLGDYYATLAPEFTPNFYHLYTALLGRILRGEQAPLEAQYDWLGDSSPDAVLQQAFAQAVEALAEEFGNDDPSTWHTRAALTRYQAVGLGSVEPHPVMNRGTYNQLAVVELAQSAPPGAPADPATPPDVRPARGLPATGTPVAALGLLAVALAVLLRRRPREARGV